LLITNTSEGSAGHLSVLVDAGSGTPTATKTTAAANTGHAGVALAPQ